MLNKIYTLLRKKNNLKYVKKNSKLTKIAKNITVIELVYDLLSFILLISFPRRIGRNKNEYILYKHNLVGNYLS